MLHKVGKILYLQYDIECHLLSTDIDTRFLTNEAIGTEKCLLYACRKVIIRGDFGRGQGGRGKDRVGVGVGGRKTDPDRNKISRVQFGGIRFGREFREIKSTEITPIMSLPHPHV